MAKIRTSEQNLHLTQRFTNQRPSLKTISIVEKKLKKLDFDVKFFGGDYEFDDLDDFFANKHRTNKQLEIIGKRQSEDNPNIYDEVTIEIESLSIHLRIWARYSEDMVRLKEDLIKICGENHSFFYASIIPLEGIISFFLSILMPIAIVTFIFYNFDMIFGVEDIESFVAKATRADVIWILFLLIFSVFISVFLSSIFQKIILNIIFSSLNNLFPWMPEGPDYLTLIDARNESLKAIAGYIITFLLGISITIFFRIF